MVALLRCCAQGSLQHAADVSLRALGVARVVYTRLLAECARVLASLPSLPLPPPRGARAAGPAPAAPPLVLVGPLPASVRASDVVGSLREGTPRPRVVLVANAEGPSFYGALTAGADHVVSMPLTPAQVRAVAMVDVLVSCVRVCVLVLVRTCDACLWRNA